MVGDGHSMRWSILTAIYAVLAVAIAGCVGATLATLGYLHQLMRTSDIPLPGLHWTAVLLAGLGVIAISVGVLALFETTLKSRSHSLSRLAVALILSLALAYLGGRFMALVHGSARRLAVVHVRLDPEVDVVLFYQTSVGDYVGIGLDATTHRLGHMMYEFPGPLTNISDQGKVSYVTYAQVR